jgi:hypothetical protein
MHQLARSFAAHVHGFSTVAPATHSSVTMALIWWLLPLFGVTGAIIYVIWVSKFQHKFANQTERSVNKFQRFQESLEQPPDGDE